MHELQPIANYRCITGENPLWNERDGRVYWEDIDSGRLFRADHASGVHECFYQGEVVGGFTFQADDSLLLFEVNRIALLSPSGARRVIAEGIDPAMRRFNDVSADPEGRVFAGTIGSTDENGGLFRIDRDGSASLLWRGTGCANGMGFTPDLRGFYWTCSTTRRIFFADYDRQSGALVNRRVWYQADASEGTPDGLCVDALGQVWTTRWGGSRLYRMSPNAEILERIDFPVTRVSSVAFGGPELDVAYVTTAGGNAKDSPGADGTLYRVTGVGRGQPEFRSRILI